MKFKLVLFFSPRNMPRSRMTALTRTNSTAIPIPPEPTSDPIPIPEPQVRPKRKCSEKQLAALAAGRAKNSRFKPKQTELKQTTYDESNDK